ncbi:hypothetical protein ACIF83_23060 [Streptomyces sp. NPDC085866]|uniref:hypothetical protein n=1 Tax=unclassified Streptomyces TaxID=2593676 RepID=UPI00379D070B
MPESIVLPATPDGRRHNIRTADGGMLCGRLGGVPAERKPKRRGPLPSSWSGTPPKAPASK